MFSLYKESTMSMTCLFREPPLPPSPERKPNAKCVCSTINPLESFVFSLFRLSSSAFCVFVADNVQKLRTLQVRSMLLHTVFILRGIKADNPELTNGQTH